MSKNKLRFYKDIKRARDEGNDNLIQIVSNALLASIEAAARVNDCECMPSVHDLESRKEYSFSKYCIYTNNVHKDEFRAVALEYSIDYINDNYRDDYIDENYLPNQFVKKIKSNLSIFVNNYSGNDSKSNKCRNAFYSSVDSFIETYSFSSSLSDSGAENINCLKIKEELMPLTQIDSFPISEEDIDEAMRVCLGAEEKTENKIKSEMASFLISRITKDSVGEYSDDIINIMAQGANIESIISAIYLAYAAQSAGAYIFLRLLLGKLKVLDIPLFIINKLVWASLLYYSTALAKCLVKKFLERVESFPDYDKKIISRNIVIITLGVDIKKLNVDSIEVLGEKINTQNPEKRIDEAFSILSEYIEHDLTNNFEEYKGCGDILVPDFFE